MTTETSHMFFLTTGGLDSSIPLIIREIKGCEPRLTTLEGFEKVQTTDLWTLIVLGARFNFVCR